jgi:hypothetical protein
MNILNSSSFSLNPRLPQAFCPNVFNRGRKRNQGYTREEVLIGITLVVVLLAMFYLMIRICSETTPYVMYVACTGGVTVCTVSVISFKNILKKWAVPFCVKVTVKSIITFDNCFTMKCNLSSKLFKNS